MKIVQDSTRHIYLKIIIKYFKTAHSQFDPQPSFILSVQSQFQTSASHELFDKIGAWVLKNAKLLKD